MKFTDKLSANRRVQGGTAALLLGRAIHVIRGLPNDEKAEAYEKLESALAPAMLEALEDIGMAVVLDANDPIVPTP